MFNTLILPTGILQNVKWNHVLQGSEYVELFEIEL